jgi:uncharacterized protein (TIGR00369 family)
MVDATMTIAGELFDPSVHGWKLDHEVGFMQFAGPVWRRHEGEQLTLALLTGRQHANRNGVVHGGVIVALADHALGMVSLAQTGCSRQATISLNVQFVSPAALGDFIEVEAEIIRQTRTVVFPRGLLRVGPRVIATAEGIWKILGSRERTAPDPV